MFKRALYVVAATALTASPAAAQVYPGATGVVADIKTPSATIGLFEQTDSSPPTALEADSNYWEWDSGSWPTHAFFLDVGTGEVDSGSPRYADADFPTAATEQVPTSIGANDEMYAIAVCPGAPPDGCVGAGFLWVEESGDTLHWYLKESWSGARIADTTEYVAFSHLSGPPATEDYFRYIVKDKL